MPFYEFLCSECGHRADYIVKMGARETECAKCGEIAHYQMSFKSVATNLPNGFSMTRTGTKQDQQRPGGANNA